MARLARVVVPDLPHHVTQRGNRREQVFFNDDDYRYYLELIAAAAADAGTAIWAYCLMPNHVHFIVVPTHEDGLREVFAGVHRRYTAVVNLRRQWTGHLWQGRFHSVVMDERHLIAAARYVPLNPVRAGLTARAQDWPWSSARAHLAGRNDGVVDVAPVLGRVGDFAAFIKQPEAAAEVAAIRAARSTGRPVGSPEWICGLEARTRRSFSPGKPGRPSRAPDRDRPGLI